jgi:hypothetical protein
MEERRRRRWPWNGWRLRTGAPAPPKSPRLPAIDEGAERATSRAEPEPEAGADIARDDPFDSSERGRQG